jgi:hypothetical protein
MGYGMKYTKGGFPFKEIETGTDRVSPSSPSPALTGEELKDLRFNDKNIDLDKGADMPVRKSGFGPRTAFGGSKNPELDPSRELEDTAE